MGTMVDRMAALAAELRSDDVMAFHDPEEALGNLPCLLVTPPRRDWTEGVMTGDDLRTFRIIALSAQAAGTLDAVAELDDLVQHARDELAIDTAEPIRYPIPNGDPIPAYLCTYTEI